MRGKRLWQTLRMYMTLSSYKRTWFLRKENVFASIGDNCSIMDRKIPLYANLIKIGNNVHIASKVDFITHDITHAVLNRCVIVLNNCGNFAHGGVLLRRRLAV